MEVKVGLEEKPKRRSASYPRSYVKVQDWRGRSISKANPNAPRTGP